LLAAKDSITKKSMKIKLLLICLLLAIPYSSWSQGRTESWRQMRQQKRSESTPEKQSKLQSFLLRIEEEGFVFGFKGFYPGFANLSTGSGLAPSVRYWQPRLFGTSLDLQASAAYSFRSYQLYTVQFGRILQFVPERLVGDVGSGGLAVFRGVRRSETDFFLFADLRYLNFPQEDFFGLGPNSEKDNRTDYLLDGQSYDGVFGVKISDQAAVVFRAGYLESDVGEGTDSRFPNTEDVFDESEAPGLNEELEFIRTLSIAFADFRDTPGNPHKGAFFGFAHYYFDSRDEPFDFQRYVIDARGYLPLGSKQRVLAARFLTTLDDTKDGHSVPFYMQETLGGSGLLRGFREFRFRDLNTLYLSAEYRWEAAPAWELAFFYDTGKVFADRSDFNFEDLEDSYGFGTRFKFPEGVFMRFDVARSDEGTRFYWTFNSSF
jgi:outer membrane protein assembly factor BamA